MKKITGFICILTLLFIVPPHVIHGQQTAGENGFWKKATITVNTTLLLDTNNTVPSYYFTEEQTDLFYSNPDINIGIDYALSKHLHIRTGLTYTTSQIEQNSSLIFVIPPPADAITHFQSSYRFHNLTLEPNAALQFDISNWSFFWSAGPLLSTSILNTDIDGAPYNNAKRLRDYKEMQSRALSLGVQGSTGVRYFFHKNIGLNMEVGYQYLAHQKLSTVMPTNNKPIKLQYRNSTLIHRMGLVIKL